MSSLTQQGVVQMGAGAHSAGSSSFFWGLKMSQAEPCVSVLFSPKKGWKEEVTEILQGNYQLEGL